MSANRDECKQRHARSDRGGCQRQPRPPKCSRVDGAPSVSICSRWPSVRSHARWPCRCAPVDGGDRRRAGTDSREEGINDPQYPRWPFAAGGMCLRPVVVYVRPTGRATATTATTIAGDARGVMCVRPAGIVARSISDDDRVTTPTTHGVTTGTTTETDRETPTTGTEATETPTHGDDARSDPRQTQYISHQQPHAKRWKSGGDTSK